MNPFLSRADTMDYLLCFSYVDLLGLAMCWRQFELEILYDYNRIT